MKKLNKLVLAAGSIAAVAAPVAAVVSCGSSSYAGRYDTKETDLKILSSWTTNGTQDKALNAIVDYWNKLDGTAKPEGWRHIDITHVEGGYDAIRKNLTMEFEAKDSAKVPNLIIDYPDTLGTLAKYDMQESIIADGDATFKAELAKLFDSSFTNINDQIGGLAAGNTYLLPMAKSIDMATLNYPVLAHIIREMKAKNWITLDASSLNGLVADGTIQKNVDKFKEAINFAGQETDATYPYATDAQTVIDIWGAAKAATSAVAFNWENTFGQGKDLLAFVKNVGDAFETKNKQGTYVFGIDSAVNFVYQSVFQKVNAEMDHFLFSKDKDANGYISYNWQNQPEAKAAFKEVSDQLQAALDSGAIYLGGGGSYSSSLETQHKIAFAYGSTAGYSHNFVNAPVYAAIDGKAVTSIPFANALGATTNADYVATYKSGAYENGIIKSTSAKVADNYNVKSADAATDKALDDFVKAHPKPTTSSATDKFMFVVPAALAATVTDDQKVKINDANYLVLTTTQDLAGGTLQSAEMDIFTTASKWDANSQHAAQLIQGPSMIGVHNNAAEDKSMQAFVKWYMTGDFVETNKQNVSTTTRPYLAFAAKAYYIAPTKDGFARINSNSYASDQLTAATLQKMPATITAFDNPADDSTGDFRSDLQQALTASFKASITAGGHTLSADQIYSRVGK